MAFALVRSKSMRMLSRHKTYDDQNIQVQDARGRSAVANVDDDSESGSMPRVRNIAHESRPVMTTQRPRTAGATTQKPLLRKARTEITEAGQWEREYAYSAPGVSKTLKRQDSGHTPFPPRQSSKQALAHFPTAFTIVAETPEQTLRTERSMPSNDRIKRWKSLRNLFATRYHQTEFETPSQSHTDGLSRRSPWTSLTRSASSAVPTNATDNIGPGLIPVVTPLPDHPRKRAVDVLEYRSQALLQQRADSPPKTRAREPVTVSKVPLLRSAQNSQTDETPNDALPKAPLRSQTYPSILVKRHDSANKGDQPRSIAQLGHDLNNSCTTPNTLCAPTHSQQRLSLFPPASPRDLQAKNLPADRPEPIQHGATSSHWRTPLDNRQTYLSYNSTTSAEVLVRLDLDDEPTMAKHGGLSSGNTLYDKAHPPNVSHGPAPQGEIHSNGCSNRRFSFDFNFSPSLAVNQPSIVEPPRSDNAQPGPTSSLEFDLSDYLDREVEAMRRSIEARENELLEDSEPASPLPQIHLARQLSVTRACRPKYVEPRRTDSEKLRGGRFVVKAPRTPTLVEPGARRSQQVEILAC